MILSNQVRCQKCGDTAYSAHRHDLRYCRCGAIAVDGGMAYLRRIGAVRAYDDMSIEFPDTICHEVIALADEVITADADYNPLGLFIILSALSVRGVVISGLTPEQIMLATRDACYWAKDNGSNGLGALCAIARYIRDAGGTWEVPADV